MVRKSITQEELLKAVCLYEKNVKQASLVGKLSEDASVYKFKGSRKDKLVVVMLDGFCLLDKLAKQIALAKETILREDGHSDNIEIFTTAIITESKTEILESPLLADDISLTIVDQETMQSLVEFTGLMEEEIEHKNNEGIDPAYFDYLAMSNESSDIKNQFFYALLLMDVSKHQPVEEQSFVNESSFKYGKSAIEIKRAIKALRRQGRLTPPQMGNVFSLTDKEQRVIDKSVKDSRSLEQCFINGFRQLLDKYKVIDGEIILERLKSEFLARYNGISGDFVTSDDRIDDFPAFVGRYLGENTQHFLMDLSSLCNDNDYLDQYALNHAFFNLFRSDKYEEYLERKEFEVFLDTPVIANYICSKSSYNDEYNLTWNDMDYLNAVDLFGYQEENNDKISFVIPHDYLQETIGELKKALQFSWFKQIKDTPIKPITSNIFYNYYELVKAEKESLEEDVSGFSIEDFARELGFSEVDPDAPTFMKSNVKTMRAFLKRFGCDTLSIIEGYYDQFERVKTNYEWYLHEHGRDKSNQAINADVRQALFITKGTIEQDCKETESFLVSWDNTLYKLRDLVKDDLELEGRTYGVYKPGELADKLAFRNFRISKENVKNEVLAYANNCFNTSDKIRSLFDNVLCPYFAASHNKNSKLVTSLLTMEKAQIDGGVEKELPSRGEKTVFEDVFLSIVLALPKYSCSKQNLRDFLVDEENNDFILSVFKDAFKIKEQGGAVNIAECFCEQIKAYVNVKTEDIKLS